MKNLLLFFLLGVIFSSCIEMTKKQCIAAYREADSWYIRRTHLAGDNQETINTVYNEYKKKLSDLDSKCN